MFRFTTQNPNNCNANDNRLGKQDRCPKCDTDLCRRLCNTSNCTFYGQYFPANNLELINHLAEMASKRGHSNSANALNILASIYPVTFINSDRRRSVDVMVNSVTTCKDISQDQMGDILRECGELMNQEANNLKDESHETEVYR